MLTARQRQLVDFIRAEMRQTGTYPTRRKMAETLGVKSHGVVNNMLTAIRSRGIEICACCAMFYFDDKEKTLKRFAER